MSCYMGYLGSIGVKEDFSFSAYFSYKQMYMLHKTYHLVKKYYINFHGMS